MGNISYFRRSRVLKRLDYENGGGVGGLDFGRRVHCLKWNSVRRWGKVPVHTWSNLWNICRGRCNYRIWKPILVFHDPQWKKEQFSPLEMFFNVGMHSLGCHLRPPRVGGSKIYTSSRPMKILNAIIKSAWNHYSCWLGLCLASRIEFALQSSWWKRAHFLAIGIP